MMSTRRLKRQWLRAIGALETGQPSTSAGPQTLSRSLVEATLGKIGDDDLWVALACIDAVKQRLVPLATDPILLRHILAIGIQATNNSVQATDDALIRAEATLRTLGARRTLLRYTRMLDVWNKVFGPEADRFASRWDAGETADDAPDMDEDGEYDAWADLAETTPSPIAPQSLRTEALAFVLSSPVQQAMQLALADQPRQLSSFLRALPRPLALEIFPRRLALVRALILTTTAAGGGIKSLYDFGFLPGLKDGQEADVWIQLLQSSTDAEDFTDKEDVRQALASRDLEDAASIPSLLLSERDAAGQEGLLGSDELVTFYKDAIFTLERQLAAVDVAAHLAALVSSTKMGIFVDDDFLRLAEDLRLFVSLVYGRGSIGQTRQWPLSRFREACAAATDIASRTMLALLYVEGATDQEASVAGARDGAVPLLRAIVHRHALDEGQQIRVDQQAYGYFSDMLLALADKGNIRTLGYLLQEAEACGVPLEQAERLRILTASILGTQSFDSARNKIFDALLSSVLPASSCPTPSSDARKLKDVVGVALGQSALFKATPSVIYSLLRAFSHQELTAYLKRCHAYQEACQRLSLYTDMVTIAWLASMDGSRDEQLHGVMRIVRAFGHSAGHAQQYSQVADALRANTGPQQTFDQIDVKDVVRIVLEGAARSGDVHMFEQVLGNETNGLLTAEEQETIILDAANELYDNSTSANLHRGDMKVAYDMLCRLQEPVSTRVQQFKAFMEASSRLCSFRIPSELHSGALLSPIEIRLSTDRLNLIKRLLGSRDDAYRTPDMILDIALKLCAIAPGARQENATAPVPQRAEIENSVLAMLTDAALSQSDYTHAQASCEKLTTNVLSLGKRVEQRQAHDADSTLQAGTLQLFEQAKSLAHRTCHQLSKQPDWSDYASRLRWAGFALAFCPSEQLAKYLSTWRYLAQQLEEEMRANPPKALLDDLEHGGIGRTVGSLGGLGAALQAGTGGLSAAGLAALSQFGGSLESYANPLGALFSRAPAAMRPLAAGQAQGRRTSSATSSTAGQGINLERSGSARSTLSTSRQEESGESQASGSPASRAARLFDHLGSASDSSTPAEGAPGYMDPAERAARAARRFFGGFGGAF